MAGAYTTSPVGDTPLNSRRDGRETRDMSSSGEAEATLRRSMEYLRLKTSHLIDAWGFGKTERWDADLDTGVLKFSSPGLLVTAPLQVIGTFNYDDSSW